LSKARRFFITISFQLCFRISHYEGRRNPDVPKLEGTYQHLAYADGMNVLRDNVEVVNKKTDTIFNASNKVCLEINVEKSKYLLLSRHQNVSKNRDIKIANGSFENASQFKYL
jgi:hypothetical protein